jgi:hypothetical protein
MTRARTKSPVGTSKPRKKLVLKKTMVRDLETKGRADRIKGGLAMSYVRQSVVAHSG